jgi:hypothetical protein
MNLSISTDTNLELPLSYTPVPSKPRGGLAQELKDFCEFGQPTRMIQVSVPGPNGDKCAVRAYVNEFWTAKQRQANSLHEVSYRACFKPQLPRFFIERLTVPGDVVYDPFMGRGTTLLEAALLGRVPYGNDANPLSIVMARPRLTPPTLPDVAARLNQIDLSRSTKQPEDLLVFYHPKTFRAICSLRDYFLSRRKARLLDSIDEWICLIALNRLTGHAPGFFSVYTLPPNQAVSVQSQRKINEKRNQVPPQRDVAKLILKKTRQLLRDVDYSTHETLARVAPRSLLSTDPADATPAISSNSISLIVTSPPFLNVVQYSTDNWLRCWFLGLDAKQVKLTVPAKLDQWQASMTRVFRELHRILKPGGHIAFEVGEVHAGKTRLEEAVLPCGLTAGLEPLLILINDQKFTKTANCWGVDNMSKGTNTNRIVLFRKP